MCILSCIYVYCLHEMFSCHIAKCLFFCNFIDVAKEAKLLTELKPIIDNKILKTAILKAGQQNTSELESFHSLLNYNAPKMMGFSYSGQLSRYNHHLLHFIQKRNFSPTLLEQIGISTTVALVVNANVWEAQVETHL